MSKNYPYATERTPMPILEARLRLVKQLRNKYREALANRTLYCEAHGIDYRFGGCYSKPSKDSEHDRLFWLWNSAHVEAEMLDLRIRDIQRKLHIWPYA